METDKFKLTTLERLALEGVRTRERDIQEKLLTPLQEDFSALTKELCTSRGLKEDAIGTTYAIDFATNRLVEKPEESPQTVEDAEPVVQTIKPAPLRAVPNN